MRKLKLLFAAAAILLGGGLTANAQTDVTASYIGDVNRIIQGGGHNCSTDKHILSNAGGNQGEGYFNTQSLGTGWHNFVANTANVTNGVESWTGSAGGEGWILGRVMVLPQGKYTLKFTAMSTNQSGTLTNTVVKCGTEEKEFVGQGTYDEYSFDIDVTTANTPYEFGIYQKNGGTGNWSVMGAISLTLNSTNIIPVDNSSISSFTYSGNQTWHTNTWSLEGNKDGSKFITPFHELWVSSGNKLADATIKGTYTPKESGVYKVSAWVRAMNESGGAVTGAKIFVGDVEADACSGSVVYSGKGRLGTYTAMADGVAGTAFEYGFILKDAEINWLAFKNVTITYLGTMPQDEIDALLAQVPTGAMNASVKSTLDDYVTAFQSNASVASYNALSLYLPTAEASVAIYADINTAIESYATKAAKLDKFGAEAYDDSGIQTKYDNGTYETLAEAESELLAAYTTAVKAQKLGNTDWTALIINPSFESDMSNGWTTNMVRQNNTSFGKTGTWYAEKWEPNGTFSVSQTINAMPAGTYKLTAHAKARGVTSARLYAAGIDQAITIEDAEKDYSIKFTCVADADVIIGYEGVGTGEGASWLCVDNFTLTKVPEYNIIGLGNDWTTDHKMTQSTENENVYTFTTEVNVFGNEDASYFQYKLRESNTWDGYQLPASGNGNNSWSATEGNGIYTLTFTADISANTVNCVAEKTDDFTFAVVGCKADGTEAGAANELFSTTWNTATTTEVMTKKADGTYFWEKEAELEAQTVNLKVVAQGLDGKVRWYGNGDANVSVNIAEAGTYYFTVNFDGTSVSATAEKKYPYTVAGNNATLFGSTWAADATDNDMTRNDEGIYVKAYENKVLTAGTIEYKVVRNHDWEDASYGYNGGNATATIPANGTYHVIFTFNPTTTATGCEIIPAAVTKTISEAGYATYCSPYALDFSESGLTAYIAEMNGAEVSFTAVTSVPANTGVLLKGSQGDHTIKTAVSSDTNVDANKFIGTVNGTTAPAGSFVLLKGGQGVGFYKTTAEFTVGANTAYLPALPTATRFIGFDSDETTGISTMNDAQSTMHNEIYDLQGRRVMNAKKGLYIMNGRKVFVK